jgi:hypothetical protein
MSFTFPRVDAKKPGYSPEQVDQFLTRARAQFNNPVDGGVTAHDVRNTEFDLVHGGYSPEVIDGAMDKLEDSFASREIQRQRVERGSYALDDRLARVVELIRGGSNALRGSDFQTPACCFVAIAASRSMRYANTSCTTSIQRPRWLSMRCVAWCSTPNVVAMLKLRSTRLLTE